MPPNSSSQCEMWQLRCALTSAARTAASALLARRQLRKRPPEDHLASLGRRVRNDMLPICTCDSRTASLQWSAVSIWRNRSSSSRSRGFREIEANQALQRVQEGKRGNLVESQGFGSDPSRARSSNPSRALGERPELAVHELCIRRETGYHVSAVGWSRRLHRLLLQLFHGKWVSGDRRLAVILEQLVQRLADQALLGSVLLGRKLLQRADHGRDRAKR